MRMSNVLLFSNNEKMIPNVNRPIVLTVRCEKLPCKNGAVMIPTQPSKSLGTRPYRWRGKIKEKKWTDHIIDIKIKRDLIGSEKEEMALFIIFESYS